MSVSLKAQQHSYEILIGAGTLARLGDEARRLLTPQARRIVIISNPKVFNLYGEAAVKSLRAADFTVDYWLMGDGERHKSLRTLESALGFLADTGLERSDAIVSLGGGVVGDLAGFAAAVYLRGISFLHVPTTLLAQVDASVGGKTAVNLKSGKNLVGAFHSPRAVLIDTDTLRTLPARELTAGWCECIKQGAVGSRKLFDETCRFLETHNGSAPGADRLSQIIAAQCAFKASIVRNDERENINRTDHRSRRILNFGHTTAHALEVITGYKRFRHGEAVGYGMLVAGEISARLGLLDAAELETLKSGVRLCGPLPRASDLDHHLLMNAFTHDKKSVGGSIKWVLLERIGRARIVDGSNISPHILRASLRAALQLHQVAATA